MTAIPKPKKVNRSVPGPQLTEYDYQEIGEKIEDALEFKNEVEISIFHRKRHESFRGVVVKADSQTGTLSLYANFETTKININSIVGIK
ncbi:YolD-like family protein [Sporosarcina sp. NPDC096371]|uniref:YolD-like family protein n=1 Tax=Sporosarcina sp. NPDC096371 TaxID=3364530 RepID=UPI00381521A8